MYHNESRMSSTSTPTRHGRGIPLPTIDTATAFHRPMSSLASNGILTPPQTCTDSRRGSIASYGCVSDVQLTGTPSVGQYSMPPTPSQNLNDPFMQQPSQFGPDRAFISAGLFHGQEPQEAVVHSAMYSNACNNLDQQVTFQPVPQEIYHSIERSQYQSGLLAQDRCVPSQNTQQDANAAMLWQAPQPLPNNGSFGEAPYCQPSQVWQVPPVGEASAQVPTYNSDSCPPLDSSFYSADSNDAKFELMTPPSPDGMYYGCSDDEDYTLIKREAFQPETCDSPSSRSPMFSARPHGIVKQSPGRRARRASSKRGRSNVSQIHVSHGMVVTCEGKWHKDRNGKIVADDPPASKPHVCNHVDETGVVCTERFERSEHLKRHQVKHDPQAKSRYPCPLDDCKKGISRSDNAGDHIKTHLKPSRKGQRNKPKPWDVTRDRLIEVYSEKEAMKMITKIEKWIRENPEGEHQRHYLW